MDVMGNEGDFLSNSENWEDIKRGTGSGKGEKEKVHSSGFSKNVRCRHVPVSWKVGSVAEGQMTCVRTEEWGGGSDLTVQVQKNTHNCMVCYSGMRLKSASRSA